MKRWTLGLLVGGFFAGAAFILATIVQNMFHVYRHGDARPGLAIPFITASAAAVIALLFWTRATRPD